jgi:hypothetical protein
MAVIIFQDRRFQPLTHSSVCYCTTAEGVAELTPEGRYKSVYHLPRRVGVGDWRPRGWAARAYASPISTLIPGVFTRLLNYSSNVQLTNILDK